MVSRCARASTAQSRVFVMAAARGSGFEGGPGDGVSSREGGPVQAPLVPEARRPPRSPPPRGVSSFFERWHVVAVEGGQLQRGFAFRARSPPFFPLRPLLLNRGRPSASSSWMCSSATGRACSSSAFFHLRVDMEQGRLLPRVLTGCSSNSSAVSLHSFSAFDQRDVRRDRDGGSSASFLVDGRQLVARS